MNLFIHPVQKFGKCDFYTIFIHNFSPIYTVKITEMKQIKEKLKKEIAHVEVSGDAIILNKLPSETHD